MLPIVASRWWPTCASRVTFTLILQGFRRRYAPRLASHRRVCRGDRNTTTRDAVSDAAHARIRDRLRAKDRTPRLTDAVS